MSPPTEPQKLTRLTEDALFESVSYYLENYEGRGVPETIIREMHRTLLPNIYDAGQYRQVQVHIDGAIITPPEAHQVRWLVPEALDALRDGLDRANESQAKLAAIVDFFHRFNAIHPFRDGNGRVSRAVLHLLLRQQGVLDAKNDFYDFIALRRDEYLGAMKEGDRGDIFPLQIMVRVAILDASLKDMLETRTMIDTRAMLDLQSQQWYDPTIRASCSLSQYLDRTTEFYSAVRAVHGW